ncbi:MAG: amidohydrolase family protein, partial [Gemmatimonadetes bacterium]|nr:amidohydrolase family protein [Gemmatimonadota bacterium]NIR80327.1 amidohydrolase family protein [Gemmatimonadota bacterium]NIT89090.1 amidohydrolase family protein [Gemmatimonadota bacterium]NIU32887.1 amidohydrolase family protein [Gemmatimonadota bacterium]NIU37293.1 amidohydrolase family protein [Gemmatimonadota bacterium]
MSRSGPGSPVLRAVAVLAAVSALAGCSGGDPDAGGDADLILRGGEIVALAEGEAVVPALAVRDGRIAYLGDGEGAEALRGPSTGEVDLGGRTVIPGFVDHHAHLYNVGMSVLNEARGGRLFIDMGGLSAEALVDSVRHRAETLPEGTWIRGKSFLLGWGDRYHPTHEPITAAAPDHPVFLTRSGHIGWLNAAGMRAVGLDAETPEVPGGMILRYADGAPTGMLLERAVEAATPRIPVPGDSLVLRAFRLGVERLAAQGVTEIFDAGFLTYPAVADMSADLGRLVRLLAEADRRAPLPLRVNLMIPGPSAYQDTVLADPEARARVSPNVRITHVKIFADGTMYCQTAALSHPFLGAAEDHRIFRTPEAEIRETALRALNGGLDVAVHAIGDAGVARVLDVYEGLLSERPDLDPGRLRIEHYTYASEADFRRARDLGVVLSVQPHWGPTPGEEEGDPRIPRERQDEVSAWTALTAMGARLASGTDNFDVPVPYLDLLRAAVAKEIALEGRGAGTDPRASALRFVTGLHPPGGGPVTRAGLRVGAPADLVVLSGNPLEAETADLDTLR